MTDRAPDACWRCGGEWGAFCHGEPPAQMDVMDAQMDILEELAT